MTDQPAPNNPPEEEKTQPGKRLRKLISGSETNEAMMSQAGQLMPADDGEASQPADEAPAKEEKTAPHYLTRPDKEPATQVESGEESSAGVDSGPATIVAPPPGSEATRATIISAPPQEDATRATIVAPPPGSEATRATIVSPPGGEDAARANPLMPASADSGMRTYVSPRGRRFEIAADATPPEGSRPLSAEERAQDERQSPPPHGSGPASSNPAYGPSTHNHGDTPLPRRVEQNDPNATQVTPAAYQGRTPNPPPGYAPPVQPYQPQRPTYVNPPRQVGRTGQGAPQQGGYPQQQGAYPQQRGNAQRGGYPPAGYPPYGGAPARPRASAWKRGLGCVMRGVVILLFLVVFVVVAAGSWVVFQYFTIASTLPPVDELRQRASQFETTRILDRSGNVLYEILDPNAGRRTTIPLSKISPLVVAATIATEDRAFYSHPGFDPVAIARAFWQNYTAGNVIVSGASTITQQVARTLLLSPEERFEQSYERKAREIVLAAEITRRYTKDEILALYLNEINYGNLAYGIEAAAETYFGATAENLTLGQAAFLAGLPQSPGVYDIYSNPEDTLRRQKQVVLLMYQLSQEEGCIYVSNRPAEKVCVDASAATQAVQEIDNYNFEMSQFTMRYPHWVTYIRSLLEEQFDPQTIYRSGFTVYTTLDPTLQDEAQATISGQVAALADRNTKNGALVAIQPSTGEILAMVGSPDFNNDAIAGQINMAVIPRQPGSSIKPFTYLAAFEKGWTPATLIWDVPTGFPPSGDPNDPREPYRPVNYDGRFHGPATVRAALANSYNIPAVKTLQFVGIYDNPNIPGADGLVPFLRRFGINSLTSDQYGLSLTLGGGEVSLLDMTSGFATLANNGRRMPPVAITKIVDFNGNLVYEYQAPPGEQVVRSEHAYLISSILSDNEARAPMFGVNSVLNLPFPAAAKTGTTNDFRDNWTMGYTPDLALGVWIGNADYTEMQNVTGLTGAAPAWASYMQFAAPLVSGGSPRGFERPGGIVERVICAISGSEPSEFCSSQRAEFFVNDQPPLPKEEDLWKKANIDSWTGLRASPECSGYTKEEFTLNIKDPSAINWIRDTDQGREWAASIGFNGPILFVPERECRASDPRPEIHFAGLSDNQTITQNPVDIYAVVRATANFRQFHLEWGEGDNPENWQRLVENNPNQYDKPERIHAWDVSQLPAGKVTLRIVLESTENDRTAEERIHLNLQVPTPTPTPTTTSTQTPTNTTTPLPSSTPTITPTPLPTSTPTITPPNTLTPTPTDTSTPVTS